MRTQNPRNIQRDSEREGVQPQRNTAAVADFNINGLQWLELRSKVETIVTCEARVATRHVRKQVGLAIRRCSGGRTLGAGTTTIHLADDRLRSPRSYVLGRRSQTNRTPDQLPTRLEPQ